MNLTPDDLIEALHVVQGWHARNMGIIDSMIDSEAEAVRLEGGDEPVRLEGEMLKGFKIGLIVAKGLIGNLPFNLTEDEQEQNLNSDDLRKQLQENNAAMNTLTEDNQKIVELLAQRGLQAVDPAGDDISIHPCIMQLDKLQIEPKPLTADELKAGGWWCDDTSKYCRLTFLNKDIAVNSQSWGGRYSFCFMHNDRVYRGLPRERSRVTCSKKQIHRIGGDFYWCAP